MKYAGIELPEWAKWIARDLDGELYAFENRPYVREVAWDADFGEFKFIAKELNSPVDWRDSLFEIAKLPKPKSSVSDTPCEKASDRQVAGSHYKEMGVEPWDVVDTWPRDQRIGYYRGGALKYVMRMGSKDASNQEIEKGVHYLEKLLEVLKEEV